MRIAGLATAVAFLISLASAAQTPPASPLEGGWTLNKDLSDKPSDRGDRGEGREGHGGGGHRGGGGGGRGGGFGAGVYGGGRAAGGNKDDAQRLRNALRDELEAPGHLTIVESGSMIILTAGDGRTTRLSPDGKKIKDESTNVERRTRRDGGKIVSEISGLGGGKITETYSVDAETRQLHVTLAIDGQQGKATVNRVYDADPR